jgi:hypothetical protein
MKSATTHFLWSVPLVAVLIALAIWWERAPEESAPAPHPEPRTLADSKMSTEGSGDSRKDNSPGPVTMPAPGGSSAARGNSPVSAMRVRNAAETEALRDRHRPHLEALGHPSDAAFRSRNLPAKEPLENPPGQRHAITVKFLDEYLARVSTDGTLTISAAAMDKALAEVIAAHGLRFAREQTASDESLARLEARAIAQTGEMAMDLTGILAVSPKNSDPGAVRSAAEDLLALDAVEFVTLTSLDVLPPPPAPQDIAPPSELLTSFQTYRGNSGILMDWAWTNYQAKGLGVRVTDCEYAYNASHEDLSTIVTPQANVNSYYTGFGNDHGTAVLGILTAGENGYGMTGMVPEASTWFYPESSTVNGVSQSRLAAITAAIADSAPGDVVLLEMQTTGAQGGYGPAEYNLSVWNAVKTGTNAGILVVAAAGNGNENLDAPEYAVYRNRGDSGAIIVGAGSSARAKLSFSTYGTRVNVQGWGQNVASLGYGGFRTYGGDVNQWYTSTFSGTSSASPIVTSAVVALQSLAKSQSGQVLTPVQMRDLLVNTGKPQTGSLTTPIGPLPDMQAAVTNLQGFYNTADLSQLSLTGLPFTPAFTSATTAYSADVPGAVAAVSVVPVAVSPGAVIEVSVNSGAFQLVASGSASSALAINIGNNTIAVRVTNPGGGIQKTYVITVVSTGRPSVSAPTAAGITAVSAVLGGNVTSQGQSSLSARGIVYSPVSQPAEPLIGGPGVVHIPVAGTTGVFSTPAVGLSPDTGYRFRAYASNTAGITYSPSASFLTLSSNAQLQSLLLTGQTLSPVFSPFGLAYSLTVSSSTSTITAQATLVHPDATLRMRMNSQPYQSVSPGVTSPAFTLIRGANVFEVEVTAEDGVTIGRYITNVLRPDLPVIGSVTIGGIATTGAILGSEVVSDGGNPIVQRGIVYSPTLVNSSPTLGGGSVEVVNAAGTIGPYLVNVSGLGAGVRYSFRGFCRTSRDTAYTDTRTLVTSAYSTVTPGETTVLRGLYVAPDETVGFQIETDSRMQTVISLEGSDGLSALLRDPGGDIVAAFNGTGPVSFDEILDSGIYSLELYNGSVWGRAFSFSASALPARPDLAVGAGPALLSGAGVYSPDPGHTLALVSTKLIPVRAFVSIGNTSGTPTALRLRGSGGTSLFAVQYADSDGNQTAGIIGGYYKTGNLSRDDEGASVVATFTPSRKLLSKKRGKKPVILRRSAAFALTSSAFTDPGSEDSVIIQVRTQ